MNRIKTIIILCIVLFVSSCGTSNKMIAYYSQESNYIEARGNVIHIAYDDSKETLYLGFSELEPGFDDDCFKIVGENLSLVQERGIDEKIHMGSVVEFITAPKYFGDGYVMPIVEITVDGETLLSFSEGFENLKKWLN